MASGGVGKGNKVLIGACIKEASRTGLSPFWALSHKLLPLYTSQKPPTDGLVPAVAGYINLINSKNLVLEYRGCHGIARICYKAPYGCDEGMQASGVGGGRCGCSY